MEQEVFYYLPVCSPDKRTDLEEYRQFLNWTLFSIEHHLLYVAMAFDSFMFYRSSEMYDLSSLFKFVFIAIPLFSWFLLQQILSLYLLFYLSIYFGHYFFYPPFLVPFSLSCLISRYLSPHLPCLGLQIPQPKAIPMFWFLIFFLHPDAGIQGSPLCYACFLSVA